MSHRPTFLLLAAILLLVLRQATLASPTEPQRLSLSEALTLALEKNNQIRHAQLDETISEYEIAVQNAKYVPYVKFDFGTAIYRVNNDSLSDYTSQTNDFYQVALAERNSLGGTSSVNFKTRKDINLSSGFVATEYASEVFFRYDQPFLKGYGRDVANLDIDKAELNRKYTAQYAEDVRSQVLHRVYRDYFLLFHLAEELRIKREIRGHTEKLRDMVREKVSARILPVTDLKTIDASLFAQDKAILDIMNRRKQQENQLMISIQGESWNQSAGGIDPVSTPAGIIEVFSKIVPDAAMLKIEDKDFELIKHENELGILERERGKTVNDSMPDLVLSLELGINGYDSDTMTRSIRNISSQNYRALVIGTLAFPLRNTAARGNLAKQNIRILQTKMRISDRKNEIERAVNELVAGMETVRKKMELDDRIQSLSKENLENEVQRLLLGKSTALTIIDYQTIYARTQLDALNTAMEYLMLIGSYYSCQREMETFISPVR